MRIKEEMQPTYLSFYMNKVVSLAANKLIQNIYKCKKLPFTAYQFLQMDATEIKETLIAIVKTDQSTRSKIQKLTQIPKTFKTISLLSTNLSANPKTSSNCSNFLTKSSSNDMKCSWREVHYKIWTGSCKLEAARRVTLMVW